MKSLTTLKKESFDIQGEISKILMDNFRFDCATGKQADVTATLNTLQQHLAMVQRELREKLLAW